MIVESISGVRTEIRKKRGVLRVKGGIPHRNHHALTEAATSAMTRRRFLRIRQRRQKKPQLFLLTSAQLRVGRFVLILGIVTGITLA
jgi:hypothetical protein